MSAPALVWFRIDLRLADNPALVAAVKQYGTVIPVFIWAPEEEAPWQPGGASRWWLHQSLAALAASLEGIGSKLIIRNGPTLETLRALVKETGAAAVFWNRRYEPAVIERDARIKKELRDDGLEVESFNAALLHEPWTVQNLSKKPFQVFTPFWKHCLAKPAPADPLPSPKRLEAQVNWPKSVTLASLALEPKIKWAETMRATWLPGEAEAAAQLKQFIANGLADYTELRNRPDLTGTSRLSPHMHFGEISPRQIWHAAAKHGLQSQFFAEIGWREFAHHLLYHFPHTPTEPLRENFKKFPWRKDKAFLKAWQRGRTGYPLVDAGMRELWATGWMHNRVRMVVGSFLVKDLLLTWREGGRVVLGYAGGCRPCAKHVGLAMDGGLRG